MAVLHMQLRNVHGRRYEIHSISHHSFHIKLMVLPTSTIKPTTIAVSSVPFATPSPNPVASRVSNDMSSHKCSGCGNSIDECHEVKYRYYCLHAVIDYFDEVGMNFVTQHGIYAAFMRAYTSARKKDMLESFSYYERNVDCEIPECMERASLEDAQQIHKSNQLFQFLMSRRVHDVESFFEDLKAGRVTTPFYPEFETESEEKEEKE